MAAPSPATVFQARTRLRLDLERAAPIALFVAALLLYILTLTQVHTFDALSYVTSVEHKPWTEVFHPHHLAYGPLGALALALAQALGYAGGAALPMQLVNAAAGALGVALFFAFARRVTGRADLALVAALLLGGAYAYWYYAVEIEVYTVATLFLLVCLNVLVGPAERPSLRCFWLLGMAQGGAILFHQTNVLFCVPALVFWILDLELLRNPKSKIQNLKSNLAGWLAYALALALTVGLPYLFVGVVVSGFRSWDAFEGWLTEYARTGWWGGPITAQKWADLGKGLADTLAQPSGALFWLLLLGLALLHARRLYAGARPLVGMLSAWLLAYGAFFLWWEPDNVEFWIASLPPALLLLALALRGARRWGPEIWVALAVAGTVLALNYDSIARRGDAATDLQRTIARALAARSQAADLLLVPDGLLELYLPYYERRDNFVSLNQALFDSGGDWSRACAAMRSHIDAALYAGATALVADEALAPPELLLRRYRLAQSQVDTCFAPYRESLEPLVLGADLPGYWRLPTGQERAAGGGWRFESSSEGWRAQHVGREQFDGGWHFVPGSDPVLTSPLLQLDARRYQAIEIRIANGTHARDAQLFFAGPGGAVDEARSARWTLEPTAEPTTYRVELNGRPGWDGTITRLRLDPVGVGDGGEMQVEWVRLIPR
jgi:hypothetical protein